ESHRAAVTIQSDVVHADSQPRGFQFVRLRDAPFAPEKSPAAGQRAGRDVKRAFCRAVQSLALEKQPEEFGFNFDCPRTGVAVDVTDLAALAENGELIFQPVNQIKRVMSRGDAGAILRRQRDLEPAGHRRPVQVQPVIRARRRGVAREREKLSPIQHGLLAGNYNRVFSDRSINHENEDRLSRRYRHVLLQGSTSRASLAGPPNVPCPHPATHSILATGFAAGEEVWCRVSPSAPTSGANDAAIVARRANSLRVIATPPALPSAVPPHL